MLQEIDVASPTKFLTDTRISYSFKDETIEFQIRLSYGNIICVAYKLARIAELSEKKSVENILSVLKPDVAHIVKVARKAALEEIKRIKSGDTYGNVYGNKNNKSSTET